MSIVFREEELQSIVQICRNGLDSCRAPPPSLMKGQTHPSAVPYLLSVAVSRHIRIVRSACRPGDRGMLQLLRHSYLSKPFTYAVFRACNIITRDTVTVHQRGLWLHTCDVVYRSRPSTASVRRERNEGLACKIIFIKDKTKK